MPISDYFGVSNKCAYVINVQIFPMGVRNVQGRNVSTEQTK